MNNAWTDLARAAASVPRLAGAACRGHHWMADVTDASPAGLIVEAAAICSACPARQACGDWIGQLEPHERPGGYVAGQLLGTPPAPPRRWINPAADDEWLADYLAARGGRVVAEQAVTAAGCGDASIPAARLRAARRRIGATVTAAAGSTFWVAAS